MDERSIFSLEVAFWVTVRHEPAGLKERSIVRLECENSGRTSLFVKKGDLVGSRALFHRRHPSSSTSCFRLDPGISAFLIAWEAGGDLEGTSPVVIRNDTNNEALSRDQQT